MWPFSKKSAEVPVIEAPKTKRVTSTAAQQRAYAAAQLNRLTSDWIMAMTSPDEEVRSSLRGLRARARELGRENDWVRGLLREFEINVVGRGINVQLQVKKQRGGVLDDDLNSDIETKFYRWMKAENCDVAGTLRFQDMEQMITRNWVEAGEVIIRRIYQKVGKSKVPLSLQILEADHLDDEYNTVLENGNVVKMGVEVNQWGRPMAYHLLFHHPGEHSFGKRPDRRGVPRIRVPAEEIIHVFRPERPGQTRGVPLIVSTMMRLRQMHGYEEAEVVFARASASLMGTIESDSEELQGDATTEDGQVLTDFEPGKVVQLRDGESFKLQQVTRPGGQYEPFIRSNLRAFSAGTGPAYTAISADYSQSNYSSERAAILKERDMWRMIQDWLVSKFHQPVFESWMSMAWLSGQLKLPKYDTNPELYEEASKWFPRGWQWIDPAKEVASYKEAIKGGLMTLSDVLQQSGSDLEEFLVQRQREIQLSKEYGVVLDTDFAQSKPAPPPENSPTDPKKEPKKDPKKEDDRATA